MVSSPASVKLAPLYVEPCALWIVRQYESVTHRGDRAHGAVDHAKASVVAEHHDLVTDADRHAADVETVTVHQPGCDQALPRPLVELQDVAPVRCLHHSLAAGPGIPPVVHHALEQFFAVAHVQAPVRRVGRHGRSHLAVTQVSQGVALPRLDLAPVLQKPMCAQAQDQAPEAAAGIDRGELPRVPDNDHLRPLGRSVVEQPAQLAAPRHARLVEDDGRARGKGRPGQLEEQLVHRVAGIDARS